MLMILVYFPSGECVDDAVNNRTNYQFTSVPVLHFMNCARVCWIIRRTFLNTDVCLNRSWRYKSNQIERHDEKPRNQMQLFQNLVLQVFYSVLSVFTL